MTITATTHEEDGFDDVPIDARQIKFTQRYSIPRGPRRWRAGTRSRRGAQSRDAVTTTVVVGSSQSGSIPLAVVVVPLARDDHHTSHAISCTAQIGQLLSLPVDLGGGQRSCDKKVTGLVICVQVKGRWGWARC
jgi:hypothetical protein